MDGLVKERSRGVPLQYLLGTEFFGDLELEVRRGVLVPRYVSIFYCCGNMWYFVILEEEILCTILVELAWINGSKVVNQDVCHVIRIAVSRHIFSDSAMSFLD